MESAAQLRKRVLLVLIVVALMSSFGAAWYTGDWGGLLLNFGTEIAGAVLTYLLLERVIGRRENHEAKKADLIGQMGSSVKDVAVAAADELKRRGWLWDGSLQGAILSRANLQEADLVGANLQEADLVGANLQGAFLSLANLQEAHLDGANLQGAFLSWANLQGAIFGEATTLPDGTKWTPGTDVARFTDPDHPDFWRPDV